jgi:magnesium transporter
VRTDVFEGGQGGLRWVDVVGPSRAELLALAEEFGLHATSVADCLDPEHLPKHERIGEATFLILRAYDEASDQEAGDLHAMTRKVAIFYRSDLVLTIHRKDQPVLVGVRERYQGTAAAEHTLTGVVSELVLAAINSYEAPLEAMEGSLDAFEGEVFDPRHGRPSFRRIHFLKRRVALIKRVLWQTITATQKLVPPAERSQPYFQDLRESAEGMHFWADQLLEEAHNLVNVQLAMATHRTNEVMRILTVFAAFFLPLTFIAGVYGMNFVAMPELAWPLGYPMVLIVMGGVSLATFLWFRRRGWIGRRSR